MTPAPAPATTPAPAAKTRGQSAPLATTAASDVGVRDYAFGTSASAPTAEKPQSKLWFNDGSWWGVLWTRPSTEYEIYQFNWSTDTWTNTGVVVDDRNRSRADVLWDGSHLFIVTHQKEGTSGGDLGIKVLRYSYNANTETYSLDPGFPVVVATGAIEAGVLDKDTTGKLWVTYTKTNGSGGRSVYVTHSTTNDTTWVTPYVVPVSGANNLSSDDISALVAYNGQIGVMWSNQNAHTVYFASHADGAADNAWSLNPALQGPSYADDHINLKSLQADASGQVWAAVKTSLNDVEPPTSAQPLILLLILDDHGGWQRRTFGRVSDNHTRPIVLIDDENREVYVFAVAPCCSGGAIYYKKTSTDNPNFASGLGIPFIQLSTDPVMTNPTSTKQTLNSTTGLLVEAADDHSRFYAHNKLTLPASDHTAPDTTIDAGPSGTVGSASATFAFSSTETGSTFGCTLDGGAVTACTAPTTYSGLADGSHTFTVRATDPAGNVDPTPASRTWTIDATAPAAPLISSPAEGSLIASGTVDLAGSADDGATVEVFEGAASRGTTTADGTGAWSLTLSGVADGSHTYTATASDPLGNTSDPSAGRTIVVDTTAPNTTIDAGPSGTVPSTSATFDFSATETGATFGCTLDGTPATACTSPTTYSDLAEGAHTFTVRATDPAGNPDPTPASRTWTIDTTAGTTLFSDGFESGTFSEWTIVRVGGDGTATVQSSTVKSGSFAAQVSETSNTGSFAYARKTLPSARTDLTVAGDFRILAEGASGGNVPLIRVFDSAGNRLVSVYRLNGSANRIGLSYGGAFFTTSGTLALNTWRRVTLRVVAAGASASTIEVRLDQTLIYSTTTASFTVGVRSLQIGNETARQAGTVVADDIEAVNAALPPSP